MKYEGDDKRDLNAIYIIKTIPLNCRNVNPEGKIFDLHRDK